MLWHIYYGKSKLHPLCTCLVWISRVTIWAMTWQNQQSEYAPSEDSDQPGHPPSLIRVFAVRMKKPWVLSYPLSAQWRLWSDWVDAQADLSLRWAHTHFVDFVMSQLISCLYVLKHFTIPIKKSISVLFLGCKYRASFHSPRLNSLQLKHLYVR